MSFIRSSHEFSSILKECNVKQAFIDFLLRSSVFVVEDFVWAAKGDKTLIDTEIIDASGVADLGFQDKIAIRKAWWIADIAMKKKEAVASAPAAEANAPISTDDSKNLHEDIKLILKRAA